MSRQAHLPPRCPFQKKSITSPNDLISPSSTSWKDRELYPRHHKSISQGSILDEQPAWIDDLLNDSDSNSKGVFHRRSSSDSATLLDGLVSLPNLKTLDDNSTGSGLESACMYGPNSPRNKGKLTLPENAIVSALSEYVSQNPLQCLEGDICNYGTAEFDSVLDAFGSAGDVTSETKPMRRHSGQRSRVRKLEYIAELERTVYVFQTLGSELALRVASLLQQRVALSMENCKLKQQVARLKQSKLFVDGQYQSLRKEVERLKSCSAYSVKHSRSSSAGETVSSKAIWQMPDMGKLDIN